MFARELFGAISESIHDCITKFVFNKGCSNVRVMFYGGVAHDSAIDKLGAGNRGFRFGFGAGSVLEIQKFIAG